MKPIAKHKMGNIQSHKTIICCGFVFNDGSGAFKGLQPKDKEHHCDVCGGTKRNSTYLLPNDFGQLFLVLKN